MWWSFLHKSRGVLRKSLLKICSKFTREHPCRSVISIKLLFNFTPLDGCFCIIAESSITDVWQTLKCDPLEWIRSKEKQSSRVIAKKGVFSCEFSIIFKSSSLYRALFWLFLSHSKTAVKLNKCKVACIFQ